MNQRILITQRSLTPFPRSPDLKPMEKIGHKPCKLNRFLLPAP
jgi:hypothetical protein